MTTPFIDLTTSQSDSLLSTSTATTSVVMTTTSIPPPPPQPQQSFTDQTLFQRIERDVTYQELLLGLHRNNHHLHLLQQAHLVLQILQEHQDLLSCPHLFLLHLLVYLSDDEDFRNNHLPKADSRKDWWKPLHEEERPATPEHAWTIPSSNVSYVENNWATAYDSKGSSPALSISKMKAASYPDFGLELLVPEQMWIVDVYMILRRIENKSGHTCRFSVSSELKPTQDTDFQLVIEIYQTQLNLTILEWDATGFEFKHDYTIIESPRAVVFSVSNNERKIMRFNEIYKFSDGTLTRILEALAYRVKEFKIKRLNLGMNT
nr:hypothetical protein [Tanacetum cinerariifolium]